MGLDALVVNRRAFLLEKKLVDVRVIEVKSDTLVQQTILGPQFAFLASTSYDRLKNNLGMESPYKFELISPGRLTSGTMRRLHESCDFQHTKIALQDHTESNAVPEDVTHASTKPESPTPSIDVGDLRTAQIEAHDHLLRADHGALEIARLDAGVGKTKLAASMLWRTQPFHCETGSEHAKYKVNIVAIDGLARRENFERNFSVFGITLHDFTCEGMVDEEQMQVEGENKVNEKRL